MSLFDHLSKFDKFGSSSDQKLSEIIDAFIDSIERFRSVTQKKIVQSLVQDDYIQAKFRDIDSSNQGNYQKRFENELLEQFYHGLILEFETNMLRSTDKETNSEFIKTIPILLEELHRLELYIKTLGVEGIKIDKTIGRLVDLWLEIL